MGVREGKKTRKIVVPGDQRRGTRRTASADLGTPFMPPVGFFFVSTTARREGRETDVRSDGVERPGTARAARDRSVTRRGFVLERLRETMSSFPPADAEGTRARDERTGRRARDRAPGFQSWSDMFVDVGWAREGFARRSRARRRVADRARRSGTER